MAYVLFAIILGVSLSMLTGAFSLMLPLQRVNNSIVESTGGRCLDGSPPAYYLSLPNANSTSKWRIHLRGGGWCFSAEDCWRRSKTSLGSSSLLPVAIEDAHYGFMSTNSTVNPRFSHWGVIYVEYCDGSSYLSDVKEPVHLFGDLVYFRGHSVLKAVLLDLEDRVKLLSGSTEVILSGTSAGGLATYLHCDEVHRMLNSNCDFRCLPDAGLFLDHDDINGSPTYKNNVLAGLKLWNGTPALDPTCKKAFASVNQEWKCAFAQYAMLFISSDLFILNSMYDAASMGLVLHLGCHPNKPGDCSAQQMKAFLSYREAMLAALQPALLMTSGAGVFATACYQHEESCQNADWTDITIGAVTMCQAVERWFDGAPVKLIDTTWPNDHTCVLNITHGPC